MKSETSSKSDSGYGGMDSREKPPLASVPPLKERGPGIQGCPVLHGDQNTNSKARVELESNSESHSKNQREKSASDQSRRLTQHKQSNDAHELIEKKEISEKKSGHSRADRSPHSQQDSDMKADLSADRQVRNKCTSYFGKIACSN